MGYDKLMDHNQRAFISAQGVTDPEKTQGSAPNARAVIAAARLGQRADQRTPATRPRAGLGPVAGSAEPGFSTGLSVTRSTLRRAEHATPSQAERDAEHAQPG
nr:hypothetical protein Iba_chr12aCG13260 [Ipomoea batatas]